MRLLLALLAPACASPALPSDQYDAIAADVTASLIVDHHAIADAVSIVHGMLPAQFGPDGSAVSGSEDGNLANDGFLSIDFSFLPSCAGRCSSGTTQATVTYVSAGTAYLLTTLVGGTLATITHDGSWTLETPADSAGSLAGTTTFHDDATIAGASYMFDITASYALAIDNLGDLAAGPVALEISATEAGSGGATAFSAKGAVSLDNDTATLLLDDSREYAISFADDSVGSGSD